jgi:glycosylphosphatidylinositol transamidase (GPIT) subunit GPI8
MKIKKKNLKIETFEREIFITDFLYRLENEHPGPIPNPFVSVKSKTDKHGIKINLEKFKAKLDTDQQKNFYMDSRVNMYEMDNAGIPLLDFLESQHKLECGCGDKLKCDIYRSRN